MSKTFLASVVILSLVVGMIIGVAVFHRLFIDDCGRDLTSALDADVLLSEITQGDLQNAKVLLNATLDTQVIKLSPELPRMTHEQRVATTNLFRRIMASRLKAPEKGVPHQVSEAVSNIIWRTIGQ